MAASRSAKPAVFWALTTLLVVALAPLGIIFFPGLPSLALGIGAILLGLAITLWHLLRLILTAHPSPLAGPALAALFLIGLAALLGWLRSEMLFGYKAVDDRLAPLLVRGDHYFADRLFFRRDEIRRGEVMIFRDARGKAVAGRVAELPGEVMARDDERITLAADEYGLQRESSGASELVPRTHFEARALVIYGSYNPEAARLVWERSGQRVRE